MSRWDPYRRAELAFTLLLVAHALVFLGGLVATIFAVDNHLLPAHAISGVFLGLAVVVYLSARRIPMWIADRLCARWLRQRRLENQGD